MAWNIVGGFLKKFSNLKPSQSFYGGEISLIIKNVLGVEVNPHDVNYEGGVIIIKTKNPIARSEIFMNKSKILEGFYKKICPPVCENEFKPREIRFLN